MPAERTPTRLYARRGDMPCISRPAPKSSLAELDPLQYPPRRRVCRGPLGRRLLPMRTTKKCLAFVVLLLLPVRLFAQASVTGTVHDASGAVLPGVTVEAASSALIEKTRSAV